MEIGKHDNNIIELNKELKKCKRDLASNLRVIKANSNTNALLVTVLNEYKVYLSGVMDTKNDLISVLKNLETHLVEIILSGSADNISVQKALDDIKFKMGKSELDKRRLEDNLRGT